jgi:hypothetical protein
MTKCVRVPEEADREVIFLDRTTTRDPHPHPPPPYFL